VKRSGNYRSKCAGCREWMQPEPRTGMKKRAEPPKAEFCVDCAKPQTAAEEPPADGPH
jgi:hypothetical protein